MIAPKAYYKDCLQVEDFGNQDAMIKMDCGMICWKCGFNRYVAADRKRRIKAGDFSEKHGKKRMIKYLYVGGANEQSDPDGAADEGR